MARADKPPSPSLRRTNCEHGRVATFSYASSESGGLSSVGWLRVDAVLFQERVNERAGLRYQLDTFL